MAKPKAFVTTRDVFVGKGANGRLVPAGQLVNADEIDFSDAEEEGERTEEEKGFKPAPANFEPEIAVVAAIGPTGPNPTVPQQIPPGAEILPGGGYSADGAQLVAQGGEQAMEVEEQAQPRTSAKKKVDPLS